jgi:hypothetical protein
LTFALAVAVVVGALFVVDWPLRADTLPRRLYQIGLAFSLLFLVAAAVYTFILTVPAGSHATPGAFSSTEAFTNDRLFKAYAATVVAAGILTILGLYFLSRRPTIALATLAAGVITFLSGTNLAGVSYGYEGLERTGGMVSYLVATALATAILIAYGLNTFDQQPLAANVDGEDDDDP